MKYSEFIADLEQQLTVVRSLIGSSMTHENPQFRKWRHEVQSLVDEAKAAGFRVPGDFNSNRRAYRALWIGADTEDNLKEFRRELNDSIVELEFIVQQYRKYGDPKPVAVTPPATAPLSAPGQVSLAWLWQHVPVSLWVVALALLLATFLAGVGIGQTKIYRDVLELFHPQSESK